MDAHPARRFYGRRKGKRLPAARADALETVFPAVEITLPPGDGAVSPAAFFLDLPAERKKSWVDWNTSKTQVDQCRSLRKTPTDAENLFWNKVRGRQVEGCKFRRQVPIGPFYADFACIERKLVVEIDGGQHNENEKDEARTAFLKAEGYDVLRFWNHDVLENINGVLDILAQALSRPAGEGGAHATAWEGEGFPMQQENPEHTLPPEALTLPAARAPSLSRKREREITSFCLEIGFGNGENLAHFALNNPDTGFIGCEPFINGIATLCKTIRDHDIKNIRIFPDDARLLMARLESGCLEKCFVLNADPWPKTRHHKRRFIQQDTLDEIHRLLEPGGEFRMSSDHPGLTSWQLEKTLFHGGFEWTATRAADWENRPADMAETRYQRKNLAEHPVTFLNFLRRPGQA